MAKRYAQLVALMGLCSLALLVGWAMAQEEKPAAMPGQECMDPEAMARMAAMGTPGPEHKRLEPLVGEWTCDCTCWMDPDAPPMESQGTQTCKWIMGGRYIKYHFQGNFMGEPFEGMGLMGYDNHEKHYTSVWVDNYSTGIYTETGTCDLGGKLLTFNSEYYCPMENKVVKGRTTLRIVSDDEYVMSMEQEKDGQYQKSMELHYTRDKGE